LVPVDSHDEFFDVEGKASDAQRAHANFNHFCGTRNFTAALSEIRKVVALHRELEAVEPDDYNDGLAKSLHDYAYCLSKLRRLEEAVPILREAAGMREDLARIDPGLHEPDLAQTLHNLAYCLEGLGRYDEALSLINRAIYMRHDTVHRPFLQQHDPVQADSLSWSDRIKFSHWIGLSADCLRGLSRYEEANEADIDSQWYNPAAGRRRTSGTLAPPAARVATVRQQRPIVATVGKSQPPMHPDFTIYRKKRRWPSLAGLLRRK
jgi:tetratricopeptide (TPR) repeat protein